MPRRFEIHGRTYEFPDDVPEAEIQRMLEEEYNRGQEGGGLAKAAGRGLAGGFAGVPSHLADVGALEEKYGWVTPPGQVRRVAEGVQKLLGMGDAVERQKQARVKGQEDLRGLAQDIRSLGPEGENEGFAETLVGGLAAAPGALASLAPYAIAGPLGLPAGLGMQYAAAKAAETPEASVEDAMGVLGAGAGGVAEGLLFGAMGKTAGGLKTAAKQRMAHAIGSTAIGGGASVIRGEDPEEALAHGLALGVLGGLSKPKGAKRRQLDQDVPRTGEALTGEALTRATEDIGMPVHDTIEGQLGRPQPRAGGAGDFPYNMNKVPGDTGRVDFVADFMSGNQDALNRARELGTSLESIRESAIDAGNRLGWDPKKVASSKDLPMDVVLKTATIGAEDSLTRFQEYKGRARAEYDSGRDGGELSRKAEEAMLESIAFTEIVSGQAASGGRGLRLLQEIRAGRTPREKLIYYLEKQKKLTPEMMERVADLDLKSPEGMRQAGTILRAASSPTIRNMLFELFNANILSNPQTTIANMSGNSAAMLMTLAERPLAVRVIEPIRPGLEKFFGIKGGPKDREFVPGEELGDVIGMWKGMRPAIGTFFSSLKAENEVRAMLESSKIEHRGASIPGKTGSFLRFPLRFLQAQDNAFKSIVVSQVLHRIGVRQAIRGGAKTRGERIAGAEAFVADVAQNPHKHKKTLKLAKEESERKTYTESSGAAGSFLTKFRTAVPGLEFVIPYINTPLNLAKFAINRTPMGFFTAISKARKGKEVGGQFSENIAAATLGSAVMGIGAALTAEGYITGSGPEDYSDLKNKMQTGYTPKSFVIGGKYYPFERFDPLAAVLGIAADVVEKDTPESISEYGTKGFAIIKENLANKTFLTGLENLAAAWSNENLIEGFLKNYIGSMVPYSGLLGGAAKLIDPVSRRTEFHPSAALAKIPGMSQRLPAQYSGMGEEIQRDEGAWNSLLHAFSPLKVSSDKPGAVENAFLGLGEYDGGIPRTPPRKINIPEYLRSDPDKKTIELDDDEYSIMIKYRQMAASQLKMMTSDPSWESIDEQYRAEQISSIISMFNSIARDEILADLQRKGKL